MVDLLQNSMHLRYNDLSASQAFVKATLAVNNLTTYLHTLPLPFAAQWLSTCELQLQVVDLLQNSMPVRYDDLSALQAFLKATMAADASHSTDTSAHAPSFLQERP